MSGAFVNWVVLVAMDDDVSTAKWKECWEGVKGVLQMGDEGLSAPVRAVPRAEEAHWLNVWQKELFGRGRRMGARADVRQEVE
jgi:hypothetical protein